MSDWQLSSNTVDFRNQERRAAFGREEVTMRLWRPGDPTDPENCPVCGGNPDNCDHPTIRPPKPKDKEGS